MTADAAERFTIVATPVWVTSYPAGSDREERTALGSKRQTTMAKLTRERKVKEKRELKEEKKAAAAAAKAAGTYSYDGEPVEPSEEITTDPTAAALAADSSVAASSEGR